MRQIIINVYKFDELSDDAKKRAIEDKRKQYQNFNNFETWVIDDCGLLEPNHDELNELFGDDYDFPLIENTRKNLFFDVESMQSYLDISKAMKINNEKQFLKWLGIDVDNTKYDFSFKILARSIRFLTASDEENQKFDDEYLELVTNARAKFDEHCGVILSRIADAIKHRFSDEGILADIESEELEYTKDGKIFDYV